MSGSVSSVGGGSAPRARLGSHALAHLADALGVPVGVGAHLPADHLEHLLLDKWALQPEDKDMIIMKHEFEYALDGQEKHLSSTLVMKGEDQVNTAMAKLVGLPMAIFVKLVMTGKFNQPGVLIPVMKEAYDPVLSELREFGVVFEEVEG